jgi:hypothetical protein
MAHPRDIVLAFAPETAPYDHPDGRSVFKAVSVSPSHPDTGRVAPKDANFASPRADIDPLPCYYASSGVPGPEYHPGKALKWIGEQSIHALEEVFISKHAGILLA